MISNLSINDNAHYDAHIQRHPAYAGQIYVLVMLLDPIPKPNQRRQQIGSPREQGDASRLMTDPNRVRTCGTVISIVKIDKLPSTLRIRFRGSVM